MTVKNTKIGDLLIFALPIKTSILVIGKDQDDRNLELDFTYEEETVFLEDQDPKYQNPYIREANDLTFKDK